MQIQELKEYQKTQHPVLALECATSLSEAIRYMDVHEYGSVICTNEGQYHGIFTARLLLKKLAANENISVMTLRDVARTTGPIAFLEDNAEEKLAEMKEARVHYMPILDEQRRCVGMLSQGDFAAYTMGQAGTRFAEALKNKAEDKTNPPGMVIAMGVYALIVLGAAAFIF